MWARYKQGQDRMPIRSKRIICQSDGHVFKNARSQLPKMSNSTMFNYQRWSDYNTNVLEFEYDFFEHARVRVRVLRKQMYSSTSMITLQCSQLLV